MDTPIRIDPELEFELRAHFPLLKGRPIEIRASFPEESTYLGSVKTEHALVVLQAHQPSREKRGVPHIYLSKDERAQLTTYQLIHPTLAWPEPIIQFRPVAIPSRADIAGVVDGQDLTIPVALRRHGSIQVWYGNGIAELWEAILDHRAIPEGEHAELVAGIWQKTEQHLAAQGARQIYTLARDPAYDDAWYRDFLTDRGYAPSKPHQAATKLAWVKHLPA